MVQLFQKTLPSLVMEKLGLTMASCFLIVLNALATLALLFAFLLISFSCFTETNGVGSAIQSLLAAGGALYTKASSSEDVDKLRKKLEVYVHQLLGRVTMLAALRISLVDVVCFSVRLRPAGGPKESCA